MSEITAESIIENYVKHLQMLTIEELTSDKLTEMARDAVQAALLVGFARGKDASPSDEFYRDMLGKGAKPIVWKADGCWYPVASATLPNQPTPPIGQMVEVRDKFGGVRRARWTSFQCWGFERPTPSDWVVTRWRPIQPATPAQPEGEKPPRDYRDDLLSCAKADAERLRNDARIELAGLRSTLQNVRDQINTLYRNCGG